MKSDLGLFIGWFGELRRLLQVLHLGLDMYEEMIDKSRTQFDCIIQYA